MNYFQNYGLRVISNTIDSLNLSLLNNDKKKGVLYKEAALTAKPTTVSDMYLFTKIPTV